MSAYLPVRGTIFELASRVVDPAFGFAMGRIYFYASVMLVCIEYGAVATIIQYWNTSVNPAVWVAIAMVVCIIVNVVGVKYYGETEFIACSIKIFLLAGLCMLTLVTICGGNPEHDAYGFHT
ncbi:amino acid permease/ SLC12A domain-containing protein [Ilyonectria sp. MPI-CAGE-AT-0026]|nr:amino acid permease/ SLC12A domain-containing protein [Ilyonectria sp. MPI-CAGE-AT-0026]